QVTPQHLVLIHDSAMLEKSFGLLFYLKQSKNQKVKSRYVYLRIIVNGKFREISTKMLWYTDRWNAGAGKAVGNKEDARNLNSYLDVLTAKVYQAKKMLVEEDRELTSESLKNILQGKSDDRKMVLEIFQHHNDQVKALIGKEYAPLTLRRFKTCLAHTRAFIQWKYKVDDLPIKDLDFEFISEFSFWLKTVKSCAHNSTVKYLVSFKKIVLSCVRKGWLKRDPFAEFKLSKQEVIKYPLSKEELSSLSGKTFEIERVNQVRDIFLFCCYTGLAYIDIKMLRRAQIAIGIDGEQWIFTNRQKTEAPTRVPLLPKAIEIMKKYENHPKCCSDGSVLPVLSNQKMNSYLKEIADLCGITTVPTFHVARHTFATTVTLSNNVPLETVSKMLGHKSLRQTQHYAKILDGKISHDMMALKNKLG
uniref:site-specific integrase n=1 Tax=Dyadobacter tibetensis TaxID=1211851 RepID=UPI001E45F457